jgi:hypothetical protein
VNSARIMCFRPGKVWVKPHLATLGPPPMGGGQQGTRPMRARKR